jgi:hypothetical protein
MPQVGFEPTFPVFERAKRVHDLDGAATGIGTQNLRQFFLCVSWGGVIRRPLIGLLYQPRMMMIMNVGQSVECRMRIGRGNRSTRKKTASLPLCPPQIPHELTWDWTRAAAVGSLSYGTDQNVPYCVSFAVTTLETRADILRWRFWSS